MCIWKRANTLLTSMFSQINLIFWTKPLMYASKEAKCLYKATFLAGILQRKWVTKNQKIKADPDWRYSYPKFVFFLQEHKLLAHIRIANFIICIGCLQ